MGIFKRILVFGLLALNHGITKGAAVPIANKQEIGQGSSLYVNSASVTTVAMVSESVDDVSASFRTVYPVSSPRLRTTQGIDPVALTPYGYSSPHPTRTGEDTSRSAPSSGPWVEGDTAAQPLGPSYLTSHGHSPIMTEIPHDFEDCKYLLDHGCEVTKLSPRDDDDGYGYGYGSSTTPILNGGYGSPPNPTALPPGGYGNPPPPAIDKPSFSTVTAATVTVTLARQTPISSTPTVVIVTVTSTPVSQVPVKNTTQTVTVSKPTPPPISVVTVFSSTSTKRTITPQVPVDDPTSTITSPNTPTGLPPKPVTDKNAADSTSKLNQRLMFVAAVLATMGTSMSPLVGGLALLMASNNGETRREDAEKSNKNDTSGDNGSGDPAEGHSPHRGQSTYTDCGCCNHQQIQSIILSGLQLKDKATKLSGVISSLMFHLGEWKVDWSKNREAIELHKRLFRAGQDPRG
ncbi:hypothetical protein F4819DRAFT_492061 [Hypoxylon fuscum]|nr:hypothetical protein F4819DRAFT_492061 [Hypoxylon fuscum]